MVGKHPVRREQSGQTEPQKQMGNGGRVAPRPPQQRPRFMHGPGEREKLGNKASDRREEELV